MSLKCLFGHKWNNGCKCEQCGETRDEWHKWVLVEGKCVEKCSICGKERSAHKWNGCKCERCDATRYVKNNFLEGNNSIHHEEKVLKILDDTVESIRKKLPIITENTKQIDCYVDGMTLISVCELTDTFLKTIDINTFVPAVKKEMIKMIKNNPNDTYIVNKGIKIKYIYIKIDGSIFAEPSVSKDDISNENIKNCPYYKDNKCIAGGQVNNCSANPQNYGDCFVYKYNSTGDISVLYGAAKQKTEYFLNDREINLISDACQYVVKTVPDHKTLNRMIDIATKLLNRADFTREDISIIGDCLQSYNVYLSETMKENPGTIVPKLREEKNYIIPLAEKLMNYISTAKD